jgi:heme exporter protein B
MSALAALLRRDLRLALRQGTDSAVLLLFFVLTASLFPFGIGPEPQLLARVAAGIIWVTALLASLLALERLFQHDYEDGSLDLLALAPQPLALIVLTKCLAHWLTTGLPLILAAPLIALLLDLPREGFWSLELAMLLGTPSLTLIGAIGAALVLGARRGGVLISLLVLPLYLPVLIFGVSATDAAIAGLPTRPQLMILAGLLLAALALCPWASAVALRQAVE